MTSKLPPNAASILAALVAKTYRGGNDLRSLDSLERRGMITMDRAKVANDDHGHARRGHGIEVTAAGLEWVRNDPRASAWVAKHAEPV
jgi:hypothetical protein